MDKIIETCQKQVNQSTLNYKHGAVIVYRNKIVSSSHNFQRSNQRSNQHGNSVHAEVAAIQKFMVRYPKRFLEEASLVVVRMNKSGDLCNSKPCSACQRYIAKHRIPVTFYSIGS